MIENEAVVIEDSVNWPIDPIAIHFMIVLWMFWHALTTFSEMSQVPSMDQPGIVVWLSATSNSLPLRSSKRHRQQSSRTGKSFLGSFFFGHPWAETHPPRSEANEIFSFAFKRPSKSSRSRRSACPAETICQGETWILYKYRINQALPVTSSNLNQTSGFLMIFGCEWMWIFWNPGWLFLELLLWLLWSFKAGWCWIVTHWGPNVWD